jgi:hypothetical protein
MPTTIAPDPAATAEVEGMRLSDLTLLSKRLGRCERRNWASVLGSTAFLLIGGDIGAWVAMWPYFSIEAQSGGPTHYDKTVYVAIAVALLVVSLALGIGALVAKRERVEAVGNVKEDLDELLKAWETSNVA